MAELDDPKVLNAVIHSLKQQLNISDIRKVSNGLEFCILKGEADARPIAIKVPRDRVFSNVNDAHIDSRTLLDQEFFIMKHLRSQGFMQIPEPLHDVEAAGFGALVMSFVPGDDSDPNEFALGQALAKIHTSKPPTLGLSAQEGCLIPELIATRLGRRWKELSKFDSELPPMMDATKVLQTLQSIAGTKQLLHMDYRRANFRILDGELMAVVDWSNALVGHPALELARVHETGETGKDFLRGYSSITPLPVVDKLTELLFRLDTAVMLALVFLSEDPDPTRVPQALKRVHHLYDSSHKLL